MSDQRLNHDEVPEMQRVEVDDESVRMLPSITSRHPVGTPTLLAAPDSLLSTGEIDHAVAVVTGVEVADLGRRFDAIYRLRGKLKPGHPAGSRLLAYLADPARYAGMSEAAMEVFVNELVSIFHDSPVLDDRYIETSATVIADDRHSEVVRDYVLQGLSRAWPNAENRQRERILGIFGEYLDHTATSLSGTAMFGLARAIRSGDLDGERFAQELGVLKETVRESVMDPVAGERSRITAISLAPALEMTEISMVLTEIARDLKGRHTAAERGAALSALVRFGETDANELLQVLATGEDPLLSRIAAQLIAQTSN